MKGFTKKRLISLFVLMFFIVSLCSFSENIFASDYNQKLKDAVVLYVKSQTALVNQDEKIIYKNEPQVVPFIKNDRAFVPIRFISESFGKKVLYDDQKRTVTISDDKNIIKLKIDAPQIEVNGKIKPIDVAPIIVENRTFVPIRAVLEALSKEVFYDRGLIIISDIKNIFNEATDKKALDSIISKVNVLPSVESLENLLTLTKDFTQNRPMYNMKGNVSIAVSENVASGSQPAQKSKADVDFSKTNVQVEGVDEADIVKTDGEFIYQINKNALNIVRAFPENQMKLVFSKAFNDEGFNPLEMFVDDKFLTVIGEGYKKNPYVSDKKVEEKVQNMPSILPMPPINYDFHLTKIYVFNIENKNDIKIIREVEVEGNYLSSRKIGSSLYFVTNKYLNYYILNNNQENITPLYKDSAMNLEYKAVEYKNIRYFPNFKEPNYMIIAGLDLSKPDKKVNISTYLGAGNNIFVSLQNMFVALNRYDEENEAVQQSNEKRIMPRYITQKTEIFKFSLTEGNPTYLSKGAVDGTILNQFSMDEFEGNFRIATTKMPTYRTDKDNFETNNLYILDETMNLTGKIENIAPNEKIYSVRFMGNRGYMVTFKKVDPLFVFDLSNKNEPKILGKLKIPGYSDYLHPYDENHIIGFGKDTIEMPLKDENDKVINTNAYYQGMKMALFDITDVENPKQKFVENIGDRGTSSPLLYNHKALLFSKDKNLLAFPVTIMKKQNEQNPLEYGTFEFQGAVFYNIDLQNGFKKTGKITHIKDEDYKKIGNYYNDGSDDAIYRILYINENIYTISNSKIMANSLKNLEFKNEIWLSK